MKEAEKFRRNLLIFVENYDIIYMIIVLLSNSKLDQEKEEVDYGKINWNFKKS